jgi:predicted N-formylglutamate amidohydrolase
MSWSGPFEVVNPQGRGPIVIVCDHASNGLPAEVGDLGVGAADMQRHIAWDIGAAAITRRLAQVFDAPTVLCGTSRLVIDCNRRLSDPTLIPAVSDGTRIPGNSGLTQTQRERRIRSYHLAYHDACREIIGGICGRGVRPLFVSVHSMTECMNGAFRPWHIALSSDENRRATDAALAALRKISGLVVGDNEPYDMNPAEDYSVPEHALALGLDYLQVEFRQDLVITHIGQERLAGFFATAITSALASCS